ncbi:MAG: hypothetical protein AB7Q17_15715 [Phycisphaerae bacterium]
MTPAAAELLRVLRAQGATTRERAITDARLATLTSLSPREISDVAAELLAAGHLVLSETRRPFGRWLLLPGADLEPAEHYAESLAGRAAEIFRRRDLVLKCIEDRRMQAAQADRRGQLVLFSGG